MQNGESEGQCENETYCKNHTSTNIVELLDCG